MRYNLYTPDGLEIGYITDEPEFRWELKQHSRYQPQIEDVIRRSEQYEMVVTGNGEVAEHAVTPPEEDVPVDDYGRLVRVVTEIPNETVVQVRRADERGKKHIAEDLVYTVDKFHKERVYVDDPAEVPEGVEPQEGEQGGVYYDTEQLGDEEDASEPWEDASFEELGDVLREAIGEENVSQLVEELPEDADPKSTIEQLTQMMVQSDEFSDDDINDLFRDLGEAFGDADPESAPAPEEVGVEVPGMDIETAVAAVGSVIGTKAANALFGDLRAPDSGEAPNPDTYVAQAAQNLPRQARGQLQDALNEATSDRSPQGEESEEGEGGEEDTETEVTEETLEIEGDDEEALVESINGPEFDALDIDVDPDPDTSDWGKPGEVTVANAPASMGYTGSTVGMSIDDFKNLQEYIADLRGWESAENFWGEANDENVEEIARQLETGELNEHTEEYYPEGIPMPWVEFGRDGTLRTTQEGRHRALAAEMAGMEDIPVRVVYNDEREGAGGDEEGGEGEDGKRRKVSNERRESVVKVNDLQKPGIDIETNTTLRKAGEHFILVDDLLMEAFEKQIWQDDMTKAPNMWERDDEVPQFVRSHVQDAIDRTDALHGDFADIPHAAALKVHEIIKDQLTDPQGWSVETVAKALSDEFEQLTLGQAEDIARTEIAATLNKARELAYDAAQAAEAANAARNITGLPPQEALEDFEQKIGYYWAGPEDHATTNICSETKDEIEARGGYVTKDELKEILREKAKEYKEEDGGLPDRVDSFVPHFQCRHTFVREDYQQVT